jgi:hypothetical protein
MNDRFLKFVHLRIRESLKDVILHDHGESLWVCSPEFDSWFFEYQNNQSLVFNGTYFDTLLELFSVSKNEKSKFLKEWFEKSIKLHVRTVSRRNSDLSYILRDFKKNEKKWDLKERYGFPYETVKNVTDIRKKNKKQIVLLEKFLEFNNYS